MPDSGRLNHARGRPVAPFYRGAAAALGLILAATLLTGCTESRVRVADRPLLVTKQDLAGFGIDPDTLQGQEIFRRNHYCGNPERDGERRYEKAGLPDPGFHPCDC